MVAVKEKNILVLGVGNLLLKDEGVGVHVARRLQKISLPPNVEVIEAGTAGFAILDYIEGWDKVIFIDTVRAGHPPGTIYRLTREDIEDHEYSFLSLHDIDLPKIFNLADFLGQKIDPIIIGVEPKEISVGLELSPEIEARIPKIIEIVLKEINRLNGQKSSFELNIQKIIKEGGGDDIEGETKKEA